MDPETRRRVETLGGIFNYHSGFPWNPVYPGTGCGVVYGESGSNGGGDCDLRPAVYLGGAGNDYSNDAFRSSGGNFAVGDRVLAERRLLAHRSTRWFRV